jgi:hypothetical protein
MIEGELANFVSLGHMGEDTLVWIRIARRHVVAELKLKGVRTRRGLCCGASLIVSVAVEDSAAKRDDLRAIEKRPHPFLDHGPACDPRCVRDQARKRQRSDIHIIKATRHVPNERPRFQPAAETWSMKFLMCRSISPPGKP